MAQQEQFLFSYSNLARDLWEQLCCTLGLIYCAVICYLQMVSSTIRSFQNRNNWEEMLIAESSIKDVDE